ncbi:MAG TPA: hypothetical protein VJZ27_01280, partial [Aggregatilineales bacterium]|nr:hypothetical protein [Aggregatilineales bacterium]
ISISSADLLHHAFGFTDDDITANAGGIITEAQQARLRRRIDGNFEFQCLPPLFGGLAFVFTVLAVRNMANYTRSADRVTLLVVMSIPWIAAIWTLFTRWRKTRHLKADLQVGMVKMVCGKAQPAWNPASLWMRIDGIWIDLTRVEFDALRRMDSVCIYYLPASCYVLSVRQNNPEKQQSGGIQIES